MGLFSRKSKVDYDLVFREQYKSLNRVHQQARDELDYKVKESLMEVVVEKYRELLELIDKGAKQDPKHFEALKMQKMNYKLLRILMKMHRGEKYEVI